MRPRSPRDTMHLVVSARAGTDREAFKASVRDYLSAAFPGHRYAFALHQDRPHLHAHAVITMRAADGPRLHPNITDFHAWRGMFAEAARGHGGGCHRQRSRGARHHLHLFVKCRVLH